MKNPIKRYFPIFVLPTLAAFMIAFLIPFILGLFLSFTEFRTVSDATFVGFSNYIKAFSEDSTFLPALWFTVKFAINVVADMGITSYGSDDVEFKISTNPGEPMKSLAQVASGGELSRIMLAIKTVLADTDDIPTLIFDEIDTGISGRTAQKVSERLSYIAKKHQVLCITHLPQIAAMADTHFEIKKMVENGKTITKIHKLNETEKIEELARLLGGAEITDAVRENAREMKRLAMERKTDRLKNS